MPHVLAQEQRHGASYKVRCPSALTRLRSSRSLKKIAQFVNFLYSFEKKRKFPREGIIEAMRVMFYSPFIKLWIGYCNFTDRYIFVIVIKISRNGYYRSSDWFLVVVIESHCVIFGDIFLQPLQLFFDIPKLCIYRCSIRQIRYTTQVNYEIIKILQGV